MRKDLFVAAVQLQRQSLLDRLAALSVQDWERLCPVPAAPADVLRLDPLRRRVRDVVAHLVVVDDMALRASTRWGAARRLEYPGAWDLRRTTPLVELAPTELISVAARQGERFERIVSLSPSAVGRLPVPGPAGRHSFAQLVARRVLHEWLHEQDICVATDAPVGEIARPEVASVVADAILSLLPARALPLVDRDRGVARILVDVGAEDAEAPTRPAWGIDFARRQYGPRVVAEPDATIRVPVATLALLLHGRDRFVEGDGGLEVDGDTELAAAVMDGIRSSAPAEAEQLRVATG